ncbi:MAG: hypothetical protein HY720_02515 [Planctomycetes bacterium]|nr:hypothetical protein [Planctomycetota bacterium]
MAKDAASARLGELAVHNRLVSRDQVSECLAIQRELGELGYKPRLGQILLWKFYIEPPGLAALLSTQARLRGASRAGELAAPPASSPRLAPDDQALLAERIGAKGALPRAEVDALRRIERVLARREIEKHWTEVAIEKGALPAEIARKLLEEPGAVQTVAFHRFSGEDLPDEEELLPAETDDIPAEILRKSRQFRLGRLAVARKLATKEDIEEALRIQILVKELGIAKRLGEILVKRGTLTGPLLARLLDLQRRMMSSVRWIDLAGPVDPAPDDRAVAELLVLRGHLTRDQVQECFFVQRAMAEMGLVKDLRGVISDKGHLTRRAIEAIWLQRPSAPRGPAISAAAASTPGSGVREESLGIPAIGPAPAAVQPPEERGLIELDREEQVEERCPSCYVAVSREDEVCPSCGLAIPRYRLGGS